MDSLTIKRGSIVPLVPTMLEIGNPRLLIQEKQGEIPSKSVHYHVTLMAIFHVTGTAYMSRFP